ncbi:MAG: plastocyanin/azurin family copper-binding protein [Candidatus Thermoplasmatota archaeon]|nr:plastocyanin/azurin family copper-binding protein [Candidatus Thermoplasmatota archaeon]
MAGDMKQVRALSLALLVIVCSLAGCLDDEEKEIEEPIDPDPNQDDGGNQTSQNNTNETNTSTNQTNTSTMVCYNRLIHYVTDDSSQDSCEAYMYLENHSSPHSEENFTGCYNSVTHNQHEGMPQDECDSFTWVDLSGRPGGDNQGGDNQGEITQEDCEQRGGIWTEDVDSAGEFYCDFGDDANNNTDARTWSVVDLNSTMLQEGVISRSMCGLIFAWAAWDGAAATLEHDIRQKISDNRSGDTIDVWSAIYEDDAMTVQIQEIKSYAEENANGSGTYILVENGNMSSILDPNAETHSGCEGEMNVGLNALMDDLFPPPTPSSCGDAVIDANEECDDGNSADGDGCSSDCMSETPADGTACDDGDPTTTQDTYNNGECQGTPVQCPDDQVVNSETGECECPEGQTECGGECVDSSSDDNNCGGCGQTCGAGETCEDGSCVTTAVEHFIDISGMAFSPNSITISVGDTITWTNLESMSHTATGDNNEFNSGTLGKDQSFSFTFTTAGTYTYHCAFHGGMTATIIVE